MSAYFRPLLTTESTLPDARRLGAAPLWFSHAQALRRDGSSSVVPWRALPEAVLEALTRPRAPVAGLDMGRTHVMGILNATPDSFSDGGRYHAPPDAEAHVRAMIGAGADLIDIGGESTRPGAIEIDAEEEIARVLPAIRAACAQRSVPVSIDTRKAAVARAALEAGAQIVNDVSGFTFDKDLAALCAERNVPVCVMHSLGDPETMQDRPRYDDVLLDVYDALAARIDALVAAGVTREAIIVDPGIGFGKTLQHNLALLRGIALFHALGCPILLGASRKAFIGRICGVERADARGPGSLAVALHAARQAVQIVRVHDVSETRQALALWRAIDLGDLDGA